MPPDTTPALYAIKLVEVLQAAAIDPRPLLRSAGLTAGALADPAREIPIPRYLRLVEAALAAHRGGDLGFLVGERTGSLEHGVLGYALLSSATLGDSLARYSRYQDVLGPLLEVSIGAAEGVARMCARPCTGHAGLSPELLTYFTQEWLAAWNPWAPLIEVAGPFFSAVRVGLPDTGQDELYRRHLGCPVSFGGEATEASFPESYLRRPLHHANPTIGALCREQCELLLQAQRLDQGLTADIHRCLARRPGDLPGMEAVARELGMTARTLRRRLLREHTRFQDVVISHRLAMARRYLKETGLAANEIAGLVGYADAGNFYRIFRRSEGMTPQQYRERARCRTR